MVAETHRDYMHTLLSVSGGLHTDERAELEAYVDGLERDKAALTKDLDKVYTLVDRFISENGYEDEDSETDTFADLYDAMDIMVERLP